MSLSALHEIIKVQRCRSACWSVKRNVLLPSVVNIQTLGHELTYHGASVSQRHNSELFGPVKFKTPRSNKEIPAFSCAWSNSLSYLIKDSYICSSTAVVQTKHILYPAGAQHFQYQKQGKSNCQMPLKLSSYGYQNTVTTTDKRSPICQGKKEKKRNGKYVLSCEIEQQWQQCWHSMERDWVRQHNSAVSVIKVEVVISKNRTKTKHGQK